MISGGKDMLAMKGLALALRATETPEFRRTFTPHRHFTGTSKIIYIYIYIYIHIIYRTKTTDLSPDRIMWFLYFKPYLT
ncbi:hypothetical protein Naga_100005g29 [Nannochloropsis gaditana]|uniref:Uncharacterized protein n=1 Tax=Nannochloropsis gaditana TaxID=72520 RepID=W7TEH4_9STRA|nr:hypothetical protein Naga_100005g29 [Nannochloropsis gaditana]